jgi:hypothetical protein
MEKSSLEWRQAAEAAVKFMPLLEGDWLDLVDEMKGIAEGADVPFENILAMNVRTEISMGMMNDGCTALSWTSPSTNILAQNWDVRIPTPVLTCPTPIRAYLTHYPVGRKTTRKHHSSNHKSRIRPPHNPNNRRRHNRQNRLQLPRRRCLPKRNSSSRRRFQQTANSPSAPRSSE